MRRVGRPFKAMSERRVMRHFNLAPEVAEYIDDRAVRRGMAASRVAEELLLVAMGKIRVSAGVRRVGFSEVELERN